jgi:uncharacterized protein YodC (DUF2158 family)
MEILTVGDVVELKSGSPKMTVAMVYNNGKVSCVWFVDDKPHYGEFIKETIKISSSKEK